MNFEEFHRQLADAPLCFRRMLRDYLRNPTERNACYIAGYASALNDAHLFKTDGAITYWAGIIDRTEADDTMCRELLAEMAHPPVFE